MTRTMGDAIHDHVGALAAARPQLAAGYVTGSPDIKWTAADWALFGEPWVTIDQGFTGSPVPVAIVRDVEPGAWTPAAAVNRAGWTAARPTIYCDRDDLSRAGGVLSCGWRGDLWLAYPGWQPGMALPAAPGCNYVAVQNQFDVAGAYDLSVVLDDTWPSAAAPVPVPSDPTEAIVNQLPLVVEGNKGPAVGRVQGLLVAAGYNLGTTGPHRDGIDQDFGPATLAAVEAFQVAHGLTKDGKVGTAQTWPALLGV